MPRDEPGVCSTDAVRGSAAFQCPLFTSQAAGPVRRIIVPPGGKGIAHVGLVEGTGAMLGRRGWSPVRVRL